MNIAEIKVGVTYRGGTAIRPNYRKVTRIDPIRPGGWQEIQYDNILVSGKVGIGRIKADMLVFAKWAQSVVETEGKKEAA